MTAYTLRFQHLPFHWITPHQQVLSAQINALKVGMIAESLDEIEITFQIAPDVYSLIDAAGYFHLSPDARESMAGSFSSSAPIEIEARLHPEVLAELAHELQNVADLAEYWVYLTENQPQHTLFTTENWYGLYVKQALPLPRELQHMGTIKTGYSTAWVNGIGADDPGRAFRVLLKTLDLNNIPYAHITGTTMVTFRLSSEDGTLHWRAMAEIRAEEKFCVVYSICPLTVTEEQITTAAFFSCQANFDLPIGNFEVNIMNGEIRFKTSLDYEGTELSVTLVNQLLQANAAMMERYLPGWMAVLQDGTSVADAIELVEVD